MSENETASPKLKHVFLEFDPGSAQGGYGDIRKTFSAKTSNGTLIQGTEFYARNGKAYGAAEISLDTDRDGLIDTTISGRTGSDGLLVIDENSITEKINSIAELTGTNAYGQAIAQEKSLELHKLVNEVLDDKRVDADDFKKLKDFAEEALNAPKGFGSFQRRTASPVYATGDSLVDESNGTTVEGRATIKVDFDGNGTQETSLNARISEDGKASLIISNGNQQISLKDTALAKTVIETVVTAREDGEYSDPEKAKLAALARSAVQIAGLDKIAGSLQFAAADTASIGDLSPNGGGQGAGLGGSMAR